jgi:hypothetical protein
VPLEGEVKGDLNKSPTTQGVLIMAKQQVKEAAVEEDDAAFDTTGGENMAGAMFENNEDGLVVNLSEVEQQKFELLPKGKQNVIIEDAEYQLSKSSGKPMWNLKLNVTDGEYKGRKLFTFFSFSEGALPGTKAALAVVAPELLDRPFRVNDPEVVASIVGRYAKVNVGIEKSEGYDEQNRVKRWFQPDGNTAFISG